MWLFKIGDWIGIYMSGSWGLEKGWNGDSYVLGFLFGSGMGVIYSVGVGYSE